MSILGPVAPSQMGTDLPLGRLGLGVIAGVENPLLDITEDGLHRMAKCQH